RGGADTPGPPGAARADQDLLRDHLNMADGIATDPVCGKQVDTLRARAVGIFAGVTYYFCSAECKAKFADPRKTPRAPSRASPPAGSGPTAAGGQVELGPPAATSRRSGAEEYSDANADDLVPVGRGAAQPEDASTPSPDTDAFEVADGATSHSR